jgi:hypothetical protein
MEEALPAGLVSEVVAGEFGAGADAFDRMSQKRQQRMRTGTVTMVARRAAQVLVTAPF